MPQTQGLAPLIPSPLSVWEILDPPWNTTLVFFFADRWQHVPRRSTWRTRVGSSAHASSLWRQQVAPQWKLSSPSKIRFFLFFLRFEFMAFSHVYIARQRNCGKVMFLVVSVCQSVILSTGGGVMCHYQWWIGPHSKPPPPLFPWTSNNGHPPPSPAPRQISEMGYQEGVSCVITNDELDLTLSHPHPCSLGHQTMGTLPLAPSPARYQKWNTPAQAHILVASFGGPPSTNGWQAGGTYPTGILSCLVHV